MRQASSDELRCETKACEAIGNVLHMLMTNLSQDPLIRKRTLQLLVYFSTTALNKNTGVMLKVLEHILLTWPALEPEYRAFNDAVKDLQGESMIELQRLAAEMPDHLLVSTSTLCHGSPDPN